MTAGSVRVAGQAAGAQLVGPWRGQAGRAAQQVGPAAHKLHCMLHATSCWHHATSLHINKMTYNDDDDDDDDDDYMLLLSTLGCLIAWPPPCTAAARHDGQEGVALGVVEAGDPR
ncbi:MAG: hypothetical protein ACT6R6_18675 [Flavobacterium sp.]|uniref:hypothetical protein n=1 Tax=Flavobacterium sp. TaxID=239 RepID=UPI004034A8CF